MDEKWEVLDLNILKKIVILYIEKAITHHTLFCFVIFFGRSCNFTFTS